MLKERVKRGRKRSIKLLEKQEGLFGNKGNKRTRDKTKEDNDEEVKRE